MIRALSLAFRSLRARPSRTLLTTLGIVLGVAVILAISIANLSTLESLTAVFSEASGKAHLIVISSTTEGQGFDEKVRYTIVNIPGVKEVVPTIHTKALLAQDAGPGEKKVNFFGAVEGGLTLYGIDAALDPTVRDYKIAQGEFLSSDPKAHEVVLVQDYAQEKEISLGQDVEILTQDGFVRLRVVGLMTKEGAGKLNNGSFGVLPLDAAQDIFGRAGDLDQIDILAQPAAASGEALDQLKAAIQDRLGSDYTVAFPATQGKRVVQMLDVYQMGLTMFSIIAIFVGAFLIYNAFSMTVIERTREIGMLRTVGMTQRQVMGQILSEAIVLGVIGSALGAGVGILLSFGLIRAMEFLLAQEVRQLSVPTDGLATSLLVGLGVTLAAAALPAWQASRISPLEALRSRSNPNESWIIRRGWPAGIGLLGLSVVTFSYRPPSTALQFLLSMFSVFGMSIGATLLIPATVDGWQRVARPFFRRVYGTSGEIGSSNVQRAKMRTTLTVTALMVGIAMLIAIRAMTEAFRTDIQDWIDGYMGGDLYAYSSLPMRLDFGPRLEAVEGVRAVTPTRYVDVKMLKSDGEEESVAYMAVDPASYQRVTSFTFSANQGDPAQLMEQLAEGDTVFISTVISEMYGLHPGDTIRLETRRGQRDFLIAAVVVDFYDRGFVIQGSWKDLRRYFRVNDVSAFQVALEPDTTPEEAVARLDALYGERRHLKVESNEIMKEKAFSLTTQAFSLFDVLALIAITVAALGVVNTLAMNVMERTREIGMLRGVGMTRWQVGKMILAEAGMLGIIGGIMGVLFGIFQSRLFVMGANISQGYEIGYVLPLQGVLVGFIIALVVSQIAAVLPGRRAAGVNVIEAIQHE